MLVWSRTVDRVSSHESPITGLHAYHVPCDASCDHPASSLFLDPQSTSLYYQPPSISHRHNCVPASPRHLLASYSSTFVTLSVQQPSAAAPTIATSTTTTTGSVQSIRFAGDWVHTFPTAHHIAHRGATWKRDLLSTAHYQATGLIHQHQAGGRDLGVGRGSRGLPESPVGVRLVLLPGAG